MKRAAPSKSKQAPSTKPRKAPVPVDPKTMAAASVQKFWRQRFSKNVTANLVSNLTGKLGFTQDKVKSISFDSLIILLREKPLISTMKATLQRIHLLTTFRHGSPSSAFLPENVNVRIFLAAYMIAHRPTHVFESMGALEQALFEAAVPLLVTFHAICDALTDPKTPNHFSSVPSKLTMNFPTMLFEYLKRFKAWKVPDEAKLTCRIKHALVALYQAEQHLPPDEPEDSKLRVEFRSQIERLRGKLSQIAGKAALDEFQHNYDSGVLPPTPGGATGSAYAALPGRMTNEQLAHELLLDPAFALHENGGCEVENPVFSRIRDSFHAAFWASLVDDLKLSTPCYVRVLRVLVEIRDGINDLTGSREEGAIAEIIDMDFIKSRIESNSLTFVDVTNMFKSVVVVLQRIQAPKRDEETKTKWAAVLEHIHSATQENGAQVICECLEFMLDRVNANRIDAANARLRLIGPVIKDHGIDYERGKFQDKLRDGTLTTMRTERWITKALGEVKDIAEQVRTGSRLAALNLHAYAVVSLLGGDDDARITQENIPETLLFDTSRLDSMKQELRCLVTIKTAIAAVANTKNSVLLDTVCDAIEKLGVGETIEVDKLELPADVARHIAGVIKPTSPVGKLFRIRTEKFLRECIVHGPPVNVDNIFTDASHIKLPKRFSERAAKVVHSICRMSAVNRDVHSGLYNTIMLGRP